jgi:hypothetical protein
MKTEGRPAETHHKRAHQQEADHQEGEHVGLVDKHRIRGIEARGEGGPAMQQIHQQPPHWPGEMRV